MGGVASGAGAPGRGGGGWGEGEEAPGGGAVARGGWLCIFFMDEALVFWAKPVFNESQNSIP